MKPLRENFRMAVPQVTLTGAGLILLLVAIAAILFHWHKVLPAGLQEEPPTRSPRGQLEFDSGETVQVLKMRQKARLEAYGWEDTDHRFAKVPITRAMDFLEQSARKEAQK